jgi:hypothetical protein
LLPIGADALTGGFRNGTIRWSDAKGTHLAIQFVVGVMERWTIDARRSTIAD